MSPVMSSYQVPWACKRVPHLYLKMILVAIQASILRGSWDLVATYNWADNPLLASLNGLICVIPMNYQ